MVNRIKQVTYSWYNVEALDPEDPKRYNEAEMQASMDYIMSIITETATNYHDNDYSRVFLGGFSQGCFLTFLLGLT